VWRAPLLTIASPVPDASALQLDLSHNELCGLNYRGEGTYTAEGITAIANALKVTASLTRLDVRSDTSLGEEGTAVLRKAAEGRSGFELKL
jgi:hypothetical protein